MSEQRDLLISFCIPVYKNAVAAHKIAMQLLSCQDDRFEVIAIDDCSEDDFIERMTTINDDRLIYAVNESNKGAQSNWNNVLNAGHAKWLYLVMGRDYLNPNCIPRLIELVEGLEGLNVGFAYDRHNKEEEICIYNGVEALKRYIGVDHPTGLIINKECYDSIENRNSIFERNEDIYPENTIKCILLRNHNGATIDSGVFTTMLNYNKTKNKSTVTSYSEDVYYSPRGRAKTFRQITSTVNRQWGSCLSKKEYMDYYLDLYSRYLGWVTIWWKKINQDVEWCRHYNTCPRYIETKEMIKNAMGAFDVGRRHYTRGFSVFLYFQLIRIMMHQMIRCVRG